MAARCRIRSDAGDAGDEGDDHWRGKIGRDEASRLGGAASTKRPL